MVTANLKTGSLAPLSRCSLVLSCQRYAAARQGIQCRVGSLPSWGPRNSIDSLPRRDHPARLPAGSEAGFITGEQQGRATGIA